MRLFLIVYAACNGTNCRTAAACRVQQHSWVPCCLQQRGGAPPLSCPEAGRRTCSRFIIVCVCSGDLHKGYTHPHKRPSVGRQTDPSFHHLFIDQTQEQQGSVSLSLAAVVRATEPTEHEEPNIVLCVNTSLQTATAGGGGGGGGGHQCCCSMRSCGRR